QVPRSDQPKYDGITYTFFAFSMIPISMEIFVHCAYTELIICDSEGVLYAFLALRNTSLSSGKYFSNACKIVFTFHTKMPEFHKKSPLLRKVCASSRGGFSVNVFTLHTLSCSSVLSY